LLINFVPKTTTFRIVVCWFVLFD